MKSHLSSSGAARAYTGAERRSTAMTVKRAEKSLLDISGCGMPPLALFSFSPKPTARKEVPLPLQSCLKELGLPTREEHVYIKALLGIQQLNTDYERSRAETLTAQAAALLAQRDQARAQLQQAAAAAEQQQIAAARERAALRAELEQERLASAVVERALQAQLEQERQAHAAVQRGLQAELVQERQARAALERNLAEMTERFEEKKELVEATDQSWRQILADTQAKANKEMEDLDQHWRECETALNDYFLEQIAAIQMLYAKHIDQLKAGHRDEIRHLTVDHAGETEKLKCQVSRLSEVNTALQAQYETDVGHLKERVTKLQLAVNGTELMMGMVQQSQDHCDYGYGIEGLANVLTSQYESGLFSLAEYPRIHNNPMTDALADYDRVYDNRVASPRKEVAAVVVYQESLGEPLMSPCASAAPADGAAGAAAPAATPSLPQLPAHASVIHSSPQHSTAVHDDPPPPYSPPASPTCRPLDTLATSTSPCKPRGAHAGMQHGTMQRLQRRTQSISQGGVPLRMVKQGSAHTAALVAPRQAACSRLSPVLQGTRPVMMRRVSEVCVRV